MVSINTGRQHGRSQRDTRTLHLPSFKNCTNIYCNLNTFIFIVNNSNCYLKMLHRHGCVEVERSPRMWEIRVRYPVATDLSKKKQVVTAPLPNAQH